MWLLRVAVAVVVALAALVPCARAAPYRAVLFSDLHLNLLAAPSCMEGHGPSPNGRYCDSSPALVRATIQRVGCADADVVLIPGDVNRHGYAAALTEEQALATYAQLHDELGRQFPLCPNMTVPVLALGNNDVQPRYPAPAPAGQPDAWIKRTTAGWPILQRLTSSQLATFWQTGFYAVDVRLGLRVLVLHTNYWAAANSHTGANSGLSGTSRVDPAGGFAWLSGELARAESDGVGVWLLGHAPPGVDHWSQVSAYHAQYATRFAELTAPYLERRVIRASFFGHEHVIQERAAGSSDHLVFMVGSVSPDKGNNPSYRIVETASSSLYTVTDMRDTYLDLTRATPAWVPMPSYSSMFGVSAPFTLASIETALSSSAYLLRQATWTPRQCVADNCAERLRCDVLEYSLSGYQTCLNRTVTAPTEWSVPLIVVLSAVGVTGFAMAALVLWRRLRRNTAQSESSHFVRQVDSDWGLDEEPPAGDELDYADPIEV